jgi:NAD(P)H-dependent FMN reductase
MSQASNLNTAKTDASAGQTVLIIMGSTRAARLCPKIALWILAIAQASFGPFNYELVDLADWPLPADDEPGIPALGVYAHAHTRAWSDKINSAAGFVIVTPQYNWGYPAPLKNALDHLYKEWNGKPVAIISYGGHGGGKCAVQLKQVADGLKMRPVPTMPGLTLTDDMIRGGSVDPEQDFKEHVGTIQQALIELTAALNIITMPASAPE